MLKHQSNYLSLFSGKLRLCVESLVVHIFPGYESHDQGRIQIEGDCTINEQHRVRLNSQCGSDFPKTLRLVFSGSFTASDMFPHFLGINTAPNSLEFPFDGGEIQENVTYSAGFNLSQRICQIQQQLSLSHSSSRLTVNSSISCHLL